MSLAVSQFRGGESGQRGSWLGPPEARRWGFITIEPGFIGVGPTTAAGGQGQASGNKIAVTGPVQVLRGETGAELVEPAIIQDLLQEVPGLAGS